MKIKRLLSYLLVAVFVLGVLPLTVAAEELPNRKLTCELHVHEAVCYGLICELEEHTHSTASGSTCTRVRCSREEFPDHYYYGWNGWQHKPDLPGSKYESYGWWGRWYCCTKAEHTHTETGENPCYGWTCGYTDHEHDEKCYEYKYVINYVLYLNGQPVDGGSGSTSGYAKLGETINADPTIDFEDITYALDVDGEQTTSMTIGVEGNTLNVRYSAEVEVPEEPEETPPVNVPPQVILNTPEAPTEIPEEEIPTTQPEEEEEVDFEEEEEFEDEEIPTDVPQTGDSSPIYTAFALIALAGAAFALTLKRSRNIG